MIKIKILHYLEEKRDWIFGGLVEDFIRQSEGSKASCCSRRLRELAEVNAIEKRIVQIIKDGRKLNVVQYRSIPKIIPIVRQELTQVAMI